MTSVPAETQHFQPRSEFAFATTGFGTTYCERRSARPRFGHGYAVALHLGPAIESQADRAEQSFSWIDDRNDGRNEQQRHRNGYHSTERSEGDEHPTIGTVCRVR